MNSILIIDDEQEILWSLGQILKDELIIFTAQNAATGLKLLEKHQIDIIICDQWMPGPTGVEFLEQVKQLYPDTIRILLTGYADIDVVIRAINRGQVYKYLSKPWNTELLKIEIHDACKVYNLIQRNKKLTQELQNHTLNLETLIETRTAQLKSSKERYQALVESIPDWVWEVDATLHFTYCSKQCQQVTGYLPDEILNKTPFDFLFVLENAKDFQNMLSDSQVNPRNIGSSLIKAIDKQGKARFLESNIRIMRGKNGEITSYIGVTRDVTAQKEFEEALINHEKELALLLQASNLITTLRDEQQLMQSILNGAKLAINSESGCLFLFDENRQAFSIAATVGFSGSVLSMVLPNLSHFQLGESQGMVGMVGESRTILCLDQVKADPRWIEIDPEIQSAMWLPITYEERLLGVLNLFSHQRASFNRTSIRLGKLFANKVAIALENSRLYKQSQRSEECYRLLVENANDVVVRIEPNGTFSFVNSRFTLLTGYSTAEAQKLHFRQLIHPDFLDEVTAYHQQRFAGEEIHNNNYEFKVITKAGSILDVDAIFSPILEGKKVIAIQGILRNITEKKQVEAAIHSYEEKLRMIFENLTEIVYSVDAHRIITFISPTIEKLFAKPAEHFIGQDLWKSFQQFVQDPVSFSQNQQKYSQVTSQKKHLFNFELEFKINGESRTLEFSEHLDYNSSGNVVGSSGVIHEITERKQAELRTTSSLNGITKAISLMIEHRDPYTAGHHRNTAKLARAIGEELKLGENRLKGLWLAAMLLDVGKISVPAEILNKTSFLSNAERSIIKTHVKLGADILDKVPWPWEIVRFVLEHHERMDGSGYPNGLMANEISLEARILAIADTIDAMINHRPYRPAQNIDSVIEEIVQKESAKFDPRVIQAVLKLYKKNFFKDLSNSMFNALF